jgi:hypothetical protein
LRERGIHARAGQRRRVLLLVEVIVLAVEKSPTRGAFSNEARATGSYSKDTCTHVHTVAGGFVIYRGFVVTNGTRCELELDADTAPSIPRARHVQNIFAHLFCLFMSWSVLKKVPVHSGLR